MNRRDFLKLSALLSACGILPKPLRAAVPPRVVVVGGGFAGATVAKYLRLWGGAIDVTLVEEGASHYACILSNLVVTGQLPVDRIVLGYQHLEATHGVRRVQGRAVGVDPGAHTVSVETASGITVLPYDRLVLAPGIDFITPNGNYNAERTPHAWKAGPQTLLLKSQLSGMVGTGGLYILTIPKAPYRCPPGPYERACVVADYLQRRVTSTKGKKGKGRTTPARVLVLDANPAIVAEPVSFGRAFAERYGSILEYRPNAEIYSVDSTARSVVTSQGTFQGSVVNVIPSQKAGKIVFDTGLANDPSGRWALVNPLSYASTQIPDIHVLGDSQGTGQPKSGHMASAEAKVCADAIIRAFNGLDPDPAPATNSACYSPISSTVASWLTASYRYDSASRTMKRVEEAFGEATGPSAENFHEMFHWADNIFADSFG